MKCLGFIDVNRTVCRKIQQSPKLLGFQIFLARSLPNNKQFFVHPVMWHCTAVFVCRYFHQSSIVRPFCEMRVFRSCCVAKRCEIQFKLGLSLSLSRNVKKDSLSSYLLSWVSTSARWWKRSFWKEKAWIWFYGYCVIGKSIFSLFPEVYQICCKFNFST